MALHAVVPFDTAFLEAMAVRAVGILMTACPTDEAAARVLQNISLNGWKVYERKKAQGFVLGTEWNEEDPAP